jgi:DNA invertase Pin-like site-specific DNA recombinase
MTTHGYARVSTADQDCAAQLDHLRAAGCDHLYADQASGKLASRPELDRLLSALRRGDQVKIVRLDRLGRSVKNLCELADLFQDRGVDLICLEQGIDTSTAAGRMFWIILAAFAQFERELIVERTRAGLAASKRRGHGGGRKRVLQPYQVQHARGLIDQGISVKDAAAVLGVGRATLYRELSRAQG